MTIKKVPIGGGYILVDDSLDQRPSGGGGGMPGPPGRDGIDGADGHDWLDSSVPGPPGYTPVKGVDYFDGNDGSPGTPGAPGGNGSDGTNGSDGYTPVKGVDYFDGAQGSPGNDGTPGADGADGSQGVKGDTGPQGIPGSDQWTYVVLASDFGTSSASAVDVTGLAFTPALSKKYEFEGKFLLRTATTTVGPRPGLAWPTGMTDGVATLWTTSSATAQLVVNGNISAALLTAVGGLPTTTASWPGFLEGYAISGATPSGTIKVQLASETAGTSVTMKAGSFIKYRQVI